jgi:hypothetical protein
MAVIHQTLAKSAEPQKDLNKLLSAIGSSTQLARQVQRLAEFDARRRKSEFDDPLAAFAPLAFGATPGEEIAG